MKYFEYIKVDEGDGVHILWLDNVAVRIYSEDLEKIILSLLDTKIGGLILGDSNNRAQAPLKKRMFESAKMIMAKAKESDFKNEIIKMLTE